MIKIYKNGNNIHCTIIRNNNTAFRGVAQLFPCCPETPLPGLLGSICDDSACTSMQEYIIHGRNKQQFTRKHPQTMVPSYILLTHRSLMLVRHAWSYAEYPLTGCGLIMTGVTSNFSPWDSDYFRKLLPKS